MAQAPDPLLLEEYSYDAVTVVVLRDDGSVLQVLPSAGASAKLVSSICDGTALIAAVHLGRDRVVRELITVGAPLDHMSKLGRTALIEAVILGDGGSRHVETVRALLAGRGRSEDC